MNERHRKFDEFANKIFGIKLKTYKYGCCIIGNEIDTEDFDFGIVKTTTTATTTIVEIKHPIHDSALVKVLNIVVSGMDEKYKNCEAEIIDGIDSVKIVFNL